MAIVTDRLDLVSATPALLRVALQGDASLALALDASLPSSWPPEFYGTKSVQFTLDQLAQQPAHPGWWLHYFILRDGRVLIGYGGYKGPPSESGTVEVGYSIVDEYQRKGYATEATRGFIDRAFAEAATMRVIAETMPDRTASIRVLEKLGFRFIGKGSDEDEGSVRYELVRAS
jgi:RimJ/RimL family protein N-acetyltransferase